nr:TPA_asm: NADH dehydrogenase subunit 6 [Pseudomyrmex elongatus]
MNKLNMVQSTLFILMTIMMMIIMWNNFHPTHLIVILIIYSIFISLNLSMLKKSFMYSIMLFLIMISGILIIFLYFSSLISNEKIYMLNHKKLMFMIMISVMIMLHTFKFNKHMQPMNNSNEFKSLMTYQNNLFSNLEWIYLYPFNSLSILCMMFLLLSMFTIIKIISSKSHPLRKIN